MDHHTTVGVNASPLMCEVERMSDKHIVSYTVLSPFPPDKKLSGNSIVACLDVLHASLSTFWILHARLDMLAHVTVLLL